MDLKTALAGFTVLTGAELSDISEDLKEYGQSIHDVLEGLIEPDIFIANHLSWLFLQKYGLDVEGFDAKESYDYLYRNMEECKAFRRYWERIHGHNLLTLDNLDQEALAQIAGLLGLQDGERLLDIGCGNGYLTEYLSDSANVIAIGIDISPVAIELANKRTLMKKARLEFKIGDINNLKAFPDFNSITVIEALYTAHDIGSVLWRLKAMLLPKGRLLLVINQTSKDPAHKTVLLAPENTDLALELTRLGLFFKAVDISDGDISFLTRSVADLAKCETEFRQEGFGDFWADRIIHDRASLLETQLGHLKRYIYLASN
ncbi:MAG TPA: methyltransferase domain-containing protein [Chitinivibrionales bacterium]|jgi:2-polyprenyl-3-methyl-5-hydroxy-6-metoxy-1,4-benzoquinol methylase|nr:methyltransferase domain-containing protein [Chitinivibrionales bacterium]